MFNRGEFNAAISTGSIVNPKRQSDVPDFKVDEGSVYFIRTGSGRLRVCARMEFLALRK